MNRYYYTKSHTRPFRLYVRYLGLVLSLFGLSVLVYFGLPVISSYAVMQRVYASQNVASPIPAIKVLTTQRIKNILAATISSVEQVDYTDAKQWFPSFEINPATPRIKSYLLDVPSIGIKNAIVSTQDYNVGIHLVNYGGTAVPPDKGNAVIFGHSSLPQLFEQNNYKTIFAKLHTVKRGDKITPTVDGVEYSYKVTTISIVSPNDFAPLMQTYDQSYLTLITCTPPGTTWERLVVKAVLSEKN